MILQPLLLVCITAGNGASEHFHEKLGYRKVAHFAQIGYKFGQWYDVPPAPKGFEYCFPESVPKRLKLYQSRQEPFKLVIRPLQKLNEQPGGKKDDQEATNNEQLITQPEEKKLVTTGSQTELLTSNDSETQTTVAQQQDQGQQTAPPSSKDEETQSKQLGKDTESQADTYPIKDWRLESDYGYIKRRATTPCGTG